MSDSTEMKTYASHRAVKSADNREGEHRGRAWPTILSAATVAVSLAALAVSVLTYLDSHKSNNIEIATSKEDYATKVSFWLTSSDGRPFLWVENLGDATISNVVAKLGVLNSKVNIVQAFVPIGQIPPCRIDKIDLDSYVTQATEGYTKPPIKIRSENAPIQGEAVYFTDANAVTWARFANGSLKTQQKINMAKTLAGGSVGAFGQITPATGC